MRRRNGIFGALEAFGNGTEEQNRGTLHGHMILWIEGFNKVREMLFSDNEDIKKKSRIEMTNYVSNLMCSTYEELEVEDHIINDENNNLCTKESVIECVTLALFFE